MTTIEDLERLNNCGYPNVLVSQSSLENLKKDTSGKIKWYNIDQLPEDGLVGRYKEVKILLIHDKLNITKEPQ